ncbi:hypothetical protein LSAT2_025629, partial [Lamellibrachia satsuma]
MGRNCYCYDTGPVLQVLLCPAVEAVDLLTPSWKDNATDLYLDCRFMVSFWL